MSTLDFIPRTLKQRKLGVKPLSAFDVQNPTKPSSSKPPIIQTASDESTQLSLPKKKGKQDVTPSWDFAFLVWLTLSDYWLWADGDLRRMMETSEGAMEPDILEDDLTVNPIGDEDDVVVDEKESRDIFAEQGYLPLDHLLKKSPVLRLVSNVQPFCDAKEIIYVNSIRQFAKDAIDIRFIVGPESSSTRAAVSFGRRRKPQSGYEVRRTDFASLKDSEFSRYSKSRWDALTVYMENVPTHYAKVPGIGKLITALLPASSGSVLKRVQNIVFPPHHQDPPGSIPICKGFALMTLSCEDHVQTLLDAWPWDSEKRGDPEGDMGLDKMETDQSAEEKSAKSSGLRICTKARWEELRSEYLLYRQQLVEEINQHQDEEDARRQTGSIDEGQFKCSREEGQVASGSKRKEFGSTVQYESGIHPDSPYPTACLVLVRHVHPETNKTTLRTLFSRAWAAESDSALDYIDYSKNTDTCYVRFGTPAHAELFVDYFSSHHVVQVSGLDSSGLESSNVQPITTEILLGKREEVYWDTIPEKLRRQAVEKTLRALHGPHFMGGTVEEAPQEGEGGGRKKRRRKAKASV